MPKKTLIKLWLNERLILYFYRDIDIRSWKYFYPDTWEKKLNKIRSLLIRLRKNNWNIV